MQGTWVRTMEVVCSSTQLVSIAAGNNRRTLEPNPSPSREGRNSESQPHDPGSDWCGSCSEHMVPLQREQ